MVPIMRLGQPARSPASSPSVQQLADLELTLLNLLCQLDAADRDYCRWKALQSQHRAEALFHPSMVLLDQVVQVLTAAVTPEVAGFHRHRANGGEGLLLNRYQPREREVLQKVTHSRSSRSLTA